jgi:hypothetical protein
VIRETSPLGSTDRSVTGSAARCGWSADSRNGAGEDYVDLGTSPPVWAKSLLTTFQVPSMRTSWK